jgi:hypothetical protein
MREPYPQIAQMFLSEIADFGPQPLKMSLFTAKGRRPKAQSAQRQN